MTETTTTTPATQVPLEPEQARAIGNALRAFPFSGAIEVLPPRDGVDVTAAAIVTAIEALSASVADYVERAAVRERADEALHADVAAMRRVLGTA